MTKKKIGVLNFQYSTHNYGAVLQAAALQHILELEGHEVEHINYIPVRKKKFKNTIKSKLLYVLEVFNKKKGPSNSGAFERFRKEFLKRSKLISKPFEFSKLAVNYDIIVVGSDQVWRPKMSVDPAAFFLSYVPKGVERVSYAASFGAAKWEADFESPITKQAKQELGKFKAISCRETSGVDLCKLVFELDSVHILDPLLYVEEGFIDAIVNTARPSNKKIVYYKLDQDNEFSRDLNSLESSFGVTAYNIYRREGVYNEYEEVSQWLRNIYDSDVVVSDSFHCLCIALRLEKKVIYCPNPQRGQARLDDLFSYLSINLIAIKNTKNMFELSKSTETNINLDELKKNTREFILLNIT